MVTTRHATERSVANWSANRHTIAKERIVLKHAKLWGLKLGRQLKKVREQGRLRGRYELHYVDGFAGPGEYENGVLGSPVQALKGLVDAACVNGDGPDIFFWAVERNPATAKSLDKAIARHTIRHPLVKVRTLNLSFLDAWKQYKEVWRKNTFLLLDGFGWQASVPEIFKWHMENRLGNSVLWSLMVRSIIRFGQNADKRPYMDRLFGTDGWPELERPGTPLEKRRRVILRVQEIAKSCGAKHVVTFDILREDESLASHHEYTLLYMGAALLCRGVFALFMGLFARGCVSPVLLSGGQQPSQRVPASFRRPAEPRNGTEHRRSVPLGRAPFWTFARRSGTVPWEGRQTCDGCDDRIPGTYIRRAANRRPLHRSPEPSPVRSGRCCLRGCQSLPLVQRSPADERERTRTGTAPAAPGFGTQAPARTSRPTQPERGCWSGRGHQRCRVLGAARARKPRRNDLRHDAGCGSGLRAARSRRLASARCRAEPAAGALLGRDAPPRDHRDRLAGTTAYALEATVVLDIIHVAAATRRAVLVVGSSKGLSAFGPRPDGSRPAHGDTWLQLRRFSAAAGSRSLDAY